MVEIILHNGELIVDIGDLRLDIRRIGIDGPERRVDHFESSLTVIVCIGALCDAVYNACAAFHDLA